LRLLLGCAARDGGIKRQSASKEAVDSMRVFISAGEPSGDLHAASLIRSLRKVFPDAEFTGYGGARMQEAGARLLYPLVDLAVMWFLNVFLNILTFVRLIFRADRHFRDEPPDAVVLVDYPGLNWWIARRAKARGIAVFYFVPPQIWAWAGWRIKKIKKYVDAVLCSLPFEPAWYHARGYANAFYVGHPYFDELKDRPLDASFLADQRARAGELVAILPGSRTQEVMRNLPEMIRAANKLAFVRPGIRFGIACLHDRHRKLAQSIVTKVSGKEGSSPGLEIEVHAARTPELIRLASAAWAVSGSVGLELMVETLPSVVLYKIRRFDLWLASFFIKSRYISLVNLLADTEVFPEYLTWRDVSDELVRWALTWLDDPAARHEARELLATLRYHVARPGASDRAAERIVSWLSQRSESASDRRERSERSPHFSRKERRLRSDPAAESDARPR
jgi:lipid-A-disaccharide synthase